MSTLWGLLWRSRNRLDGSRENLMCENGMPLLFSIRAEARAWANYKYAYLRNRPDLRREPHGWKMPKAVRVVIHKQENTR